MSLIRVNNVTKVYKKKESSKNLKGIFINKKSEFKAVSNLSFELQQGEILGYLGVNGAGKSTTIKMLTGILLPTEGSIEVDGKNPYQYRKNIAKRIGVVFGQRSNLIWDLPPIDTFNLFSKIYEIPDNVYKDRLNYIVNFMDIAHLLNSPVRKLSLGQRMCCEIVASLLHNPKILFLDEPTIGLDILNKDKIVSIIKGMNQKYGTSIILTTHDLMDVEKLCDRITIIDKGSKVYEGSLESIKEINGSINTLCIYSEDILDNIDFNDKYQDCEITTNGNQLSIKYSKKKYSALNLLNDLSGKIPNIKDITIKETSVEDIIKTIYEAESI